MLLYGRGAENDVLSESDLRDGLFEALGKLGTKKKVLAIPPDFTRFHSHAGLLTRLTWEYYREKLTDVLPALGTHAPMTGQEIKKMFGAIPLDLFRIHNWRTDITTMGEVPPDFIRLQSEGKLDYGWKAQVNHLLVEGSFDLIISLGQVVPHEVIGMANYNKNILVGTGGAEGINKSHFLGAVYGMERIMGRADNPVRRVLNYASEHFIKDLPIIYVHTVVSRGSDGRAQVRGLYIGEDIECFNRAAELSFRVNFQLMDEPLKKVVVYLHPAEYKSMWLGNKSIYRTRMAMADGGELIVLAPGLKEFGEDRQIDLLIRKYGYKGTPNTLEAVKHADDLKANLSAAAHLIHGSSEGRFSIVYCPGNLSRQEVEGVGFGWSDLKKMMKHYDPKKLVDGFNRMPGGEAIFFISNPGLGLWACRNRFF